MAYIIIFSLMIPMHLRHIRPSLVALSLPECLFCLYHALSTSRNAVNNAFLICVNKRYVSNATSHSNPNANTVIPSSLPSVPTSGRSGCKCDHSCILINVEQSLPPCPSATANSRYPDSLCVNTTSYTHWRLPHLQRKADLSLEYALRFGVTD